MSARAIGGGVLILKGPNSTPYREALEGFRKAFPSSSQIDSTNKREFTRRVQTESPELIVAIGREAAETAHQRNPEIPLLFIMVPNPSGSGLASSKTIAGVSMDIPGDVQLTHFSELLPNRKTIAVIHDSGKVPPSVNQAQNAAKTVHVELELVPVKSPEEVRQRFNLIKPVVDAVWVVPDEFATWATVWEFLLRESTRARLPLLFTNGEGAVAAGALASLTPDYRDLGRQGGEITQQLVAGKLKIAEVGIRPPESVRWVVNSSTAGKIGVAIPRAILDSAKIYP